MKEQEKFDIIKNLVESNGNKKRAAVLLNCTVRNVNLLIQRYNSLGEEGFIHGNKGRKPAIAFPEETKQKIINYYCEQYSDTNVKHFCEIVKKDLNIDVSTTTVHKWLKEIGVISPKAHRKTRKELKKKLREQLKDSSSVKQQDVLKEKIEALDRSDAHPRRSSCRYFGEMIQADASCFEWVKGQRWYLHLAVDDATGTVVGAYFDTQETLNGYYHVLYQILTNYGIPAMFYTDKRTVFTYKKTGEKDDARNTLTQFGYACETLGIDLKTTSVAQAKGRIERLNQTFQGRLPVELRRAQVQSMDEANEFLSSYLKEYNEAFAHPNSTDSVFEMQPSLEKINQTLAVISRRKIDNGHCIRFKNQYYLPVDSSDTEKYFEKGTKCLVIESFDKQLYVNIDDTLYLMMPVPDHEAFSKNFDPEPPEQPKEKHKYIPPLNHPWRQASYRRYLEKQRFADAT